MALQRFAFTGAGYNIRKSILMHINNQYVRSGDLDLAALLSLLNCLFFSTTTPSGVIIGS